MNANEDRACKTENKERKRGENKLYKSKMSINAENERTEIKPVTLRKYFEIKRDVTKRRQERWETARSPNKNKVPRGYV